MAKSERGAIATVRILNNPPEKSKKINADTDIKKKSNADTDIKEKSKAITDPSKKKRDEVVVKVPATKNKTAIKRTTPVTATPTIPTTNVTAAIKSTTGTKRATPVTPTTAKKHVITANRAPKSTSTTINRKPKDVKPKKVVTSAKETQNDTNKKEKNIRTLGQNAKRTKEPKKDDGGVTPNKKRKGNSKEKEKEKEPEEENDGDGLRIIDDPRNYLPFNKEYEVEAIVGHKAYKSKVIKYMMKWKGYDENTDENATTVHQDVPELCKEYWSKFEIEKVPSNAYELLRKSNEKKNTNKNDYVEYIKKLYSDKHIHPSMAMQGFTFDVKWPTHMTNWNTEMKKICTVLPSVLDKNILFGYVEWVNGQKTVHIITEMHKYCPEKLALYYEERVKIV